MRRVVSMALGALFVAASASAIELQEADAQPFPTKTSTFKKDDLRFVVDGRVEVPKRAKIVSLRKAKISGGETGGVIELNGSLELKAVTGGRVVLENVWLEVTPECKSLYLSGCLFVGDAGIRPSEKGPSEARIYMEATSFDRGAGFTLATCSGKVTLSGITVREPLQILGKLRGEKGDNKTELQIVSTTAHGGVEIDNCEDVIITRSALAGSKSSFSDCRELTFTAMNVQSPEIEFRQSEPKKFGKTSIKNTDFYSEKIVFAAPALKAGQAERVLFDFCWFGGRTDPESIRQTTITDVGADANVAVLATFKKIQGGPLDMVRYRSPR